MRSAVVAAILGDRDDPRRRLAALFGGEVPRSGQPPEVAMRWAMDVLERADPRKGNGLVASIRVLRAAEPRLTLRSARFLAAHAERRRRQREP